MSPGPLPRDRSDTESDPDAAEVAHRPAAGPARDSTTRSAVFWLSVAALTVLVLLTYGFAPGTSEVTLMATTTTGQIACLHDQGLSSLWTWCMSTGLPLGNPPLTGLPQIYAGWALSYLPGVSPWVANQVTGCAVAVLGGVGAYLLLRRWDVPRWVSLLATGSYLLGPNLLQLNGFAFTFDGFILLPAYAYSAVRVLDLMRDRRFPAAVLGASTLCLFMAFTDGYSFFAGAAIIGCLVLGWAVGAWRSGARVPALAGVATWGAAMAGSALAYAAWAPAGSYTGDPYLETFGQLAVDLATLVVPSGQFLLPALVGAPERGLEVWGSDTTPATNYLGLLMVVFAVVGVVVSARRRRGTDHEVVSVAAALLLTLVLSLGPTLKLAQVDAGLDASVATLPTAWLYENVPGFSSLRATNRWLVATRLCLVLLAAVGISALWTRAREREVWRAGAVVALAVLAVVEVLPDPAHVVLERRLSMDRVHYLEDGIVAEADELLDDGELILMLPSTNDFLANFLVPLTGVRSYNVGIDKNHALSSAQWPRSVTAANLGYGPGSADLVCDVLREDADAVVLPYLDTRAAPLLNGDDPALEHQRERWARRIASDPRFDAQVGEWLTVLRADPGGGCSPDRSRRLSAAAAR